MTTDLFEKELRPTGISVIGDVRWGTHFCYFYDTKQDLLETLVLYFKAGLENNEFCLWVISPALTVDEAKRGLGHAVSDLDHHLAKGDLEIHGHDDWYLHNGQYEPERVMQSWREKLNQALARGYAGMRASGDTAWVQKDQWMAFREYENEFDALSTDQRMIVLCTYPLTTSPAAQIFDVARLHQAAVARRHGAWEIVETPELKHAKGEIKRLNEELEQRIIERTNKLRGANEELKKEKEILAKIFNNIPVMIGFVGADGGVKLVNPEWERTIGWTLKELQEQNVDIFAEAYPDPSYRHEVLDFVAASTGEWADLKIKVRDGRVIDAACAVVHLSDGTKVAIAQDITERKRAEEKLKSTSEQLRALSASVRSAREEEATRIAREIHDELGQQLTGLKMDLRRGERKIEELESSPAVNSLLDTLVSATELAEGIITTVQKIASDLRPGVLDKLGLGAALHYEGQRFQERTGIRCNVRRPEMEPAFSTKLSTALFRIFQECLTNVARHAQASEVEAELKLEPNSVILSVHDNGRGITPTAMMSSGSLGLLGMKERAALLGGEVVFQACLDGGTTVRARLPRDAILS